MKQEFKITDMWPLTIIADRYQGTYSGGKYLAFNLAHDEIPEYIHGGDCDEMEFWESELEAKYIIGKGNTPQEALNDLGKKVYGEKLVLEYTYPSKKEMDGYNYKFMDYKKWVEFDRVLREKVKGTWNKWREEDIHVHNATWTNEAERSGAEL